MLSARFVVLVILAPLLEAAPALGSDLDRLISILSIMQARHDSYNPMRIRYRVQTTYTKYRFAASRNINPADKKLWQSLQDGHGDDSCEYAEKGEKMYQSFSGPSIGSDGSRGKNQLSITAFDGKLVRTSAGEKVVTISRQKPRWEDPFSASNGEKKLLALLKPLQSGQVKPEAISISIWDKPDGVPQAVSHVRIVIGKNAVSYDAWLSSEDSGYCVLRLECRATAGNLYHEYTECKYKVIDGISFLWSGVYKNYYHDKDIHQIAVIRKYGATHITTRPDEIPDSLFVLAIAPETELVDRDMGDLRVSDPTEVQKHIQAAAAEAGRLPGRNWLKWVYSAGSLFFLLACAYLMFRMLRRWRRLSTNG